MLTSDDREYWMGRAQDEALKAMNEALMQVNKELAIDGFSMSINASIYINFHALPSGEVDKRFMERCGIVADLAEDEREWVKRAGMEVSQ